MSLFTPPSLAALAPGPAIEPLSIEAILAARLADLAGRCAAKGFPGVAQVLALESEPLTIGQETDARFELLLRQRVNEAVRAVLIGSARGADLDQLALTFYGVTRLLIREADPATGTAAAYQDDDTFRDYAILSMDARSVAGPEHAYDFRALKVAIDPVTGLSGVLGVRTYGEEDGARYADGTPVIAPEILVVILARAGDGAADEALIAATYAGLSADDVRPLGDRLTVEGAPIVHYTIEGTLTVPEGTVVAPIEAAVNARCRAYADATHKIAVKVERLGISGAMQVPPEYSLSLTSPAVDIDPGSKGATYCADVNIRVVGAGDVWR